MATLTPWGWRELLRTPRDVCSRAANARHCAHSRGVGDGDAYSVGRARTTPWDGVRSHCKSWALRARVRSRGRRSLLRGYDESDSADTGWGDYSVGWFALALKFLGIVRTGVEQGIAVLTPWVWRGLLRGTACAAAKHLSRCNSQALRSPARVGDLRRLPQRGAATRL